MQSAQSANVAQYCAGERSVIASSAFEAGANRSYKNDVCRVAARGEAGLAMSTSGDNEKTAVITRVAVITSGHRYREMRRSFSVCKSPVEEGEAGRACLD